MTHPEALYITIHSKLRGVINRLIIVLYSVIPAEAGIQSVSGCRIKSGMTNRQEYYETINKAKERLKGKRAVSRVN